MRSLRVWERMPAQLDNRPLRFGLSDCEALALVESVRRVVEVVVSTGRLADEPTPWLQSWKRGWSHRCGLAVALWTRGRLRGSVVSHPGVVNRTLASTAAQAGRDPRFESLTPDEIAETRVQVSLLHAPWIPLYPDEVAIERAHTDKATLLRRATSSSIFLPEIFQIRRLETMRSVGIALAEKAGLASFDPKCQLLVCKVDELVESADRTRACRLDGPVVLCTEPADADGVARHVGHSACRWLAGLQGADGGLPQRMSVRTGRGEGHDVIRAAMTAEALAAYGQATDCELAFRVARRVHEWLGHGLSTAGKTPMERLLFTIYAGKLAWRLGLVDAARECGVVVTKTVNDVDFDPLVHAHAASFLRKLAGGVDGARERAAMLAKRLMRAFESMEASGTDMDLARWAELASALPRGSAEARCVSDWLCSLQLESGAFPTSKASTFAYARGTSKVFEVLAIETERYRPALAKALRWLRAMQYDDDAMFFVAPEHRSRCRGGFRHDGANTDAWIDAAGHVLLGLSRWERG